MNVPLRLSGVWIALLFTFLLPCSNLFARNIPKDVLRSAYEELPLSFETNRGQADARTDFLAKGEGYRLSVSAAEATLDLSHKGINSSLRMKFLGANQSARVEGLEPLPGVTNYFIGNDPAKWLTGIPNYGKVRYRSVYPGVDLVYYGRQRKLEYDLVLTPGANPTVIQLAFEGSHKLRVSSDGELLVQLPGGEIRQQKPVIYQVANGGRRPIGGKYVVAGKNRVRFQVAKYDARLPLVIDPVLTYSSYLGSSGNDSGNGVAVDSSGNVYVAGYAAANFPVSAGSYQPSFKSVNFTAFVTKLNANGSAVIYSTYLGGTGDDEIHDIEVDSSGSAYVTGTTSSTDFPVTPGAYQPFFNNFIGNFNDAFAAKLNAAGSGLVYSTYLGGNALDEGLAITVDPAGNAYVAGQTQSTNFPTTVGAYQRIGTSGEFNSFILKLNSGGTTVFYATYLGAKILDIALDGAGNAYVTGLAGNGFQTTPGAFQTSFQGGDTDGFVIKLNTAGTALAYSTYLGSTGAESGLGIAVDSTGNAYVIGDAQDTFPTTPGAFRTSPSGGGDAFVAKLNAAGSALVYSTLVGGSGQDLGDDIKVDSSGNAYLLGDTNSANFPVTPDAVQTSLRGSFDLWIAKLNPSGNGLVWSTFLGGVGEEFGSRLAIDSAGSAYVTGRTDGGDYPFTSAGYQRAFGGIFDAVVSKLGPVVVTCSYVVNPPSQAFPATGGTGSFTMTAPGGCAWTAVSNAAWITVTSGASGSSSGTVGYSVAANPVMSPRNGSITVGGQTFIVTQQTATCGFAINPIGQSFGQRGGAGQVSVTAGAGCSWTAVSNAGWISVTSGGSGSGNGTVNYSVAIHSGIAPRTGTLTIAGQSLTITQSGVTPQGVGTVRGSYWILDGNGNGLWDGPTIDKNFFWGQPEDSFVVGDWSGSGTTRRASCVRTVSGCLITTATACSMDQAQTANSHSGRPVTSP